MTRAAALAVVLLLAPRPGAQQPVFRSLTTGVEVDVRVRDKGRPVTSLAPGRGARD